MNEQNIAEQALGAALTDDELDQAVGGSGDPIDPIGGVTGGADLDLKSTPILL